MEENLRKEILLCIDKFIECLPEGIVYEKEIIAHDRLIDFIESKTVLNLTLHRIFSEMRKTPRQELPRNHFRNRFSRGGELKQEYYYEREYIDEKIDKLRELIKKLAPEV